MNIPSIESLLAELDKVKAERDELKSEIASEQRWASFYAQESLGRKAEIDTLKSALREAKEALENEKIYQWLVSE